MTQLPNDVAALVELAASHADGAQPLFEGHLESVASLYQVHPERVERARTVFTTPQNRKLACELAQQAPRAKQPAEPTKRVPAKDASTLVMEALASTATRELIMRAPMELAAVQLGAHPFVVDEARQRLGALQPSMPAERPA
jgi:hypothetical protein